MPDIKSLTAAELLRRYGKRELSPVEVTRARRYFRVADGRGYTLACDARDDIYSRVWRWCDMIAATLKIGPETTAP